MNSTSIELRFRHFCISIPSVIISLGSTSITFNSISINSEALLAAFRSCASGIPTAISSTSQCFCARKAIKVESIPPENETDILSLQLSFTDSSIELQSFASRGLPI